MLIDEQKSSLAEVVQSLKDDAVGSKWAQETNKWAIEYAEKLNEVYGDNWYRGKLPVEMLSDILLPKHGHQEEKSGGTLLFSLDTSVKDAVERVKNPPVGYSSDCLELIISLKEKIKRDGFTSNIVLAVINGSLKHVDGLHRMLALKLLVDEGESIGPIPTFLCDSTRCEQANSSSNSVY